MLAAIIAGTILLINILGKRAPALGLGLGLFLFLLPLAVCC